MAICSGDDFLAYSDYQAPVPASIPYKQLPITMKTKSGFVKKVFVSKGACREISLFKAQNTPQSKQIRNKISRVELLYIYNKGTYLKTIHFDTSYKGVNFLVE